MKRKREKKKTPLKVRKMCGEKERGEIVKSEVGKSSGKAQGHCAPTPSKGGQSRVAAGKADCQAY